MFLLKNCFSIPKLTYTLRFASCYIRQLLSEYDKEMRSALQSILNVQLTDDSWEQATLPLANGGFGIRKAAHVAIPHVASLSSQNSFQVVYIKSLALVICCSRLLSVSGVHESTLRQSSIRTAQFRRIRFSRSWKSTKRTCCQLRLIRRVKPV